MRFPKSEQEINQSDPVIHFPSFASSEATSQARGVLTEADFQPLNHEGEVARYQTSLSGDECSLLGKIESVLENVRVAIKPSGKFDVELYAFKYLPGQGVPEHRDKRRHIASMMVYLGDYQGGGFTYEDEGEQKHLQVDSGDALLLLNETSFGEWRNPPHKVEEVQTGQRMVLSGSLVRE
jgi:hypothetical protein